MWDVRRLKRWPCSTAIKRGQTFLSALSSQWGIGVHDVTGFGSKWSQRSPRTSLNFHIIHPFLLMEKNNTGYGTRGMWTFHFHRKSMVGRDGPSGNVLYLSCVYIYKKQNPKKILCNGDLYQVMLSIWQLSSHLRMKIHCKRLLLNQHSHSWGLTMKFKNSP